MSRQQYINKHLTKMLKQVETAIRQGEMKGAVTPTENIKFPVLIFNVITAEDAINELTKSGGRKKPRNKANNSMGELDAS